MVAGSNPASDFGLSSSVVERLINPKNIVRTLVQFPHGLMVRICVFHTQGRGSIPRRGVYLIDKKCMRLWCSGNISAFQAGASGSIPGGRN